MTKKNTPSPTPPKRDAIEKLCKELGIPYSHNSQPKGTASIRFMTRLKSEDKKEEKTT
jgi:hypothetical protein